MEETPTSLIITDTGEISKRETEKNKNTSEIIVETKNDDLGEKEDAVDWHEEEEETDSARVELGLVGKIWTKRNINANAFMATMKNIWQPSQGLDISSIGDNTFVFQFYHWRDKQRVVEGQPWHFDRHTLLLGDIEGNNLQICVYSNYPCGLGCIICPLKVD